MGASGKAGTLLAALAIALYSPLAAALQTGWAASVGAAQSDNIGLAPEGEERASWAGLAALNLQAREHSANLEAETEGTLEYRDYETELIDDELLFTLDAAAVMTIDPDRLEWLADDYFRQASVDVFAAPSPVNRQDVNVFSTGPELRLPFGMADNLVVGARYGNFYFEETRADSHRYSGYARWLRAVSPRTTLSLNGEATAARFTEADNDDYERADLYLRAARNWLRATVEADLGVTAIRPENREDLDGYLARLGWNLSLNSHSALQIQVTHQYTDPGHDILDTAMRDGAVGVIDEQITGDIFYNRQVEIVYRWSGDRATWRVAGAARDEDFESAARDRRFEEARAELGYELTTTFRAALVGRYGRADYRDLGHVNSDRQVGARLSYQIGPRTSAAFEASRVTRESTLAAAGYEENRGLISFRYDRGLIEDD